MELVIHSKKYGDFTVYFDEQDAELVLSCKWQIYKQPDRTGIYAITGSKRKEGRQNLSMHRMIMGNPPGMEVDHRDGNGLNNRRNNLRICTRRQNAKNLPVNCKSTTGFKGVSFRKDANLYEAHITTNRKRRRIGYFCYAIDAAKAYNEAALKEHGEFARLNKIDE